jgi:hypothetical protein
VVGDATFRMTFSGRQCWRLRQPGAVGALAKRIACRTAQLAVLAACEGSPPGLVDLSSYRPPLEGLAGYATFDRLCRSPATVAVASDSPVLALASSVDFHSKLGVLVTDPLENRAFLFGWDGKLRSSYGRAGSGPGEFRHLVDAVFLADSTIVALDRSRGVSFFGLDGHLRGLSARLFAGGNGLVVLDTGSLVVAVARPPLNGAAGPAWRLSLLTPPSGQQLREFAPEASEVASRFPYLRRTVAAASRDVGLIAVGNEYEFGIEFYTVDGSGPVGTWVAEDIGFLSPQPRPRRLRSVREFFEWGTSGSHLLTLGFLGDGTLLASWDRSEGLSKRRLFLTRYSREGDTVLFSGEVPYRLMRTHGMQVAFLDARSAPNYRVLVCDWSRNG